VAVAAGDWHSLGLRRSPTSALTVALDIKPGSCPNPLNVRAGTNSRGNAKEKKGGVLPVAVLGTATFDVSRINVSTVHLEGIEPLRYDYKDVAAPVVNGEACECSTAGPDGNLDLTLKFQKSDIVATLGTVSKGDVVPLTLTDQLEDGTSFEAVDCVMIVNGELEDTESLGDDVLLRSAVPNPFNPVTRISYYLPIDCQVALEVYDSSGRLIARLLDREIQPKGMQTVEWRGVDSQGRKVSSGVYFYRLTAGKETLTKKMVLLKSRRERA